MRCLALSGGVGGAKLAAGLAACLEPDELQIVTNTGDDFEHLGLYVSPDLDSVMYALAGINDSERGWGVMDESWQCMAALDKLGGPAWFNLGDRDLATHLWRTQLLRKGESLTEVTQRLGAALGVRHLQWPMSDDAVQTVVNTDLGELPFQRYFVERQCKPVVKSFFFKGIAEAVPSRPLQQLAKGRHPDVLVVCPSNPFVSVDPILQLPGMSDALISSAAIKVAVSPIVGGKALKGPAAKMMAELGMSCDALGVAEYYREWISHFVVDEQDRHLCPAIEALGLEVLCLPTVMRSFADQQKLAEAVLRTS